MSLKMASNFPANSSLNLTGLTDLSNVTMDTPVRHGISENDHYWRNFPEPHTQTASPAVEPQHRHTGTTLYRGDINTNIVDNRTVNAGASTSTATSTPLPQPAPSDYLTGVDPAVASILRGE